MWYVIQVMSGEERRTMELCRALLDQTLYQDIFLPEMEVMKRYHGEWHKEKARMFPGYVFVVTERVEELFLAFKKVPKLTKILGTERVPVALSDKEVRLLEQVLDAEHVAEVSSGILVGDRLVIQSGPMMGLEGLVKRIDRHKRMAVLEVEMFGRRVEVRLGVEVVGKV